MNNMKRGIHLIIEGCDASGKSTLIDKLVEMLEWEVIKGSSFELSQCTNQELLVKFANMIVDNLHSNIIFDRFIYSNEVYASLYEDFATLTDNDRRLLESAYSLDNAHIIYLYADEATLKERLNTRGDDYVKADRINPILRKYDKALLKISPEIGVTSFDTSAMTTDEIAEYIVYNIIGGMQQ